MRQRTSTSLLTAVQDWSADSNCSVFLTATGDTNFPGWSEDPALRLQPFCIAQSSIQMRQNTSGEYSHPVTDVGYGFMDDDATIEEGCKLVVTEWKNDRGRWIPLKVDSNKREYIVLAVNYLHGMKGPRSQIELYLWRETP